MSLRLGRELGRYRYDVDVVVVGGGPAGLAAALYLRRFELSTLVITETIGGQLSLSPLVENYPGIPGLRGAELALRMRQQAEKAGATIVLDRVVSVEGEGGSFGVSGSRGTEAKARAVIVAIGAKRRRLGVPGEAEFVGRGVSYCGICDAPLYKGAKHVVVVGGGDSAAESALLLSRLVEKVSLVHRRDSLRAQPIYARALREAGNIEMVLESRVVRIIGDERVRAVELHNVRTGESKVLEVDGVFIEIGFEPDVEFARRLGLETDDEGYIVVNEWMETSKPGIFAAGDCTTKWKGFRQVLVAAAQGAIAARSAYEFVRGLTRASRA